MDLISKNFEEWCSNIFDTETITTAKNLKKKNPKDFDDAFYKNLEFGTGGMRGIMGVGKKRDMIQLFLKIYPQNYLIGQQEKHLELN